MIYEDLEIAIVARLAPVATEFGIDVLPLPENQAQYVKPFEKARVTVNWKMSQFSGGRYGSQLPTKSVDHAVQQEDIEIEVVIQSRFLRGESGTYAIMEAIRRKLIGFQPLSLDPMKLTEMKPDSFTDNLWMHVMTFGTKALSINELGPTNEPMLEDVSFDENFPVNT